MGSTGTWINGIKFTPTEMSLISRAIGHMESTSETVALIHSKRGLDEQRRKIGRQAKKDIKVLQSAHQKW
jgi:hypothetical protein